MLSRRVGPSMRDLQPLTPERVSHLVGRCAPCTFWLTVPRNGHGDPGDAAASLAQWVSRVSEEWGPPGQVAYSDGEPVGHLIMAPARFVPRLAAFATAPSDPSALVLVTVCTAPEQPDSSLRKTLVQAAAKAALRHRVRAVDAVAARPVAVGRHECVLEVAPLEKLGFRVERDHPAYPRLRLDLRTTVSIKDDAAAYVSWALGRLPGLRPAPETRPDGATRVRVVASREPDPPAR